MGQASSTSAPTLLLESELGSECVYDSSLGQSRFVRTIKAVHRPTANLLVVRVYAKSDPSIALKGYVKRLRAERDALADASNVLAYQTVLETEKAGYLIRQFVGTSLYDRISTRPFLAAVEKKWIAFQLLTALRDAHERGIMHGDIKSENVLCTSHGWVYLTDFAASFKPTMLPLDDPSDFAYFYDASGRRTCYLAPERFYTPSAAMAGSLGRAEVTAAMDVFSLGCVLAELCSDGAPPFTLSQMYKYRAGEYAPDLARIEDAGLRSLVTSMLARDPAERLSSEAYLDAHRGTTFADVFWPLHRFFADVDEVAMPVSTGGSRSIVGGASVNEATAPRTGADEKLDFVHASFERVVELCQPERAAASAVECNERTPLIPLGLNAPPVVGSLPKHDNSNDGGAALLILSLLCANIRNCARPSTIISTLDMLLAISAYLTDETKLDRVLPYMVTLLPDDVGALSFTDLQLRTVDSITRANASVFTEYVLTNIGPLVRDPEVFVRCTFAQCLPTLAEIGLRYLDLGRALAPDRLGRGSSGLDDDETTYDLALAELHTAIEDCTIALLSDGSSQVRWTLLGGGQIASLCLFLGRVKTAEVVLSHAITYLNDPDWRLRSSFFEAAVPLAACVGGRSVEEYILPLMLQALGDEEDAVVARVLSSLTTLAELQLMRKTAVYDVLDPVVGFLCHPTPWLRQGAAAFISRAANRLLSPADTWCTLYPVLRSVLSADIATIDELSLLDAALPPLRRSTLDAAIAWAKRSPKSAFWRHTTPLSEADRQQLDQLQTRGAGPEIESQLRAMRSFIVRRAGLSASSRTDGDAAELLSGAVDLQKHGISLQSVFFESAVASKRGPPPRVGRVDGWPRRFSSGGSTPGSRQVSDGQVDDLRRRLMLANHGSTASSPRLVAPTSPTLSAPATPPSVAPEVASRRRVNATGVEIGRGQPSVASPDATPALGTMVDPVLGALESETASVASGVVGAVASSARFSSSYQGNETGVRALIERTYLDTMCEPMADFGPTIAPGVPRRRAVRPSYPLRERTTSHPDGTLVARLSEHTGAITSIAVAPDHVFFVTGSDDGTVRVWDSVRLDRNAASRSRHTYRHGSPVTAVALLEHSHCVASASRDGALMVHRVDVSLSDAMPRYAKSPLIRSYTLDPPGDYITAMVHINTRASAILSVD